MSYEHVKRPVVFLQLLFFVLGYVTDKLCVISECFLLSLLMFGDKIGISSDYKELAGYPCYAREEPRLSTG